jgi:hypothetical protein
MLAIRATGSFSKLSRKLKLLLSLDDSQMGFSSARQDPKELYRFLIASLSGSKLEFDFNEIINRLSPRQRCLEIARIGLVHLASRLLCPSVCHF